MSKLSIRSRKGGFTLIEIMIVVLIIGILLAIAVPNFVKARDTSRTKACIANLKQIDDAQQQWAMDNKFDSTHAVALTDLCGAGLYIDTAPQCPAGGNYTLTTVDAVPTCDVANHVYTP
jgi:prepilin-type N-terminal cleavage/methylation domain-containing protein